MVEKVAIKGSKFLWIGNSPFLDFVNTEIVQDGHPADLLVQTDDLLCWLEEAGFSVDVVVKPSEPSSREDLVTAAKGFRGALRSAVQRIAQGGSVPREILRRTNRYLRRRNHWFEVTDGKSGVAVQNRWIVEHPDDVCAPIAHSFSHFISSANLGRIRKCKNPDCVLFFYDTSKSGTRAWCSLDICGNKLRVAAFRQRAEQ